MNKKIKNQNKAHGDKKKKGPLFQGSLTHWSSRFRTCPIGSGGWIRTSDQLINSQLRYHCATPERSTGG